MSERMNYTADPAQLLQRYYKALENLVTKLYKDQYVNFIAIHFLSTMGGLTLRCAFAAKGTNTQFSRGERRAKLLDFVLVVT